MVEQLYIYLQVRIRHVGIESNVIRSLLPKAQEALGTPANAQERVRSWVGRNGYCFGVFCRFGGPIR